MTIVAAHVAFARNLGQPRDIAVAFLNRQGVKFGAEQDRRASRAAVEHRRDAVPPKTCQDAGGRQWL